MPSKLWLNLSPNVTRVVGDFQDAVEVVAKRQILLGSWVPSKLWLNSRR